MSMIGSSVVKDDDVLFGSLAKVQQKIFSYPPEGILALTRDRHLAFVTRDGLLYDWPIAEIARVRSPWYQMGEGFRCEVNGSSYWVYFNKLSSTSRTGILVRGAGVAGAAVGLAGALPLARAVAGMMEIAGARNLCSDWKAMIAAAQQSVAPAE
ncbi:MAG TPA: hypothetical protein VHB98_12480 [Chloroflexota bacterium]|nr:hypothetical protein [Chloroflexota bacterium]